MLSPNLFNLDFYILSLIRIVTCTYYEVVMIDYYQFLSLCGFYLRIKMKNTQRKFFYGTKVFPVEIV